MTLYIIIKSSNKLNWLIKKQYIAAVTSRPAKKKKLNPVILEVDQLKLTMLTQINADFIKNVN